MYMCRYHLQLYSITAAGHTAHTFTFNNRTFIHTTRCGLEWARAQHRCDWPLCVEEQRKKTEDGINTAALRPHASTQLYCDADCELGQGGGSKKRKVNLHIGCRGYWHGR